MINTIKTQSRDHKTKVQTELQLAIEKTSIVWWIVEVVRATIITLQILHLPRSEQATLLSITTHLMLQHQWYRNNNRSMQRTKEIERIIQKNKNLHLNCRGTARQIAVHNRNKWPQLKLINNRCTKLLKHLPMVRIKSEKDSKMYSNKKNQKFKW